MARGLGVRGGGVALARRVAAASRPAGSRREQDAREACAEQLRRLGFAVDEQRFEYSTFPGRWGTSVVGVGLALAAGGAAVGWIAQGSIAAVRWGTAATLGVAACGWWLEQWGTRKLPVARRVGANLVARRGVPRVWLVAHLDSKGQPVSLAARAGGVVLCIAGWASVVIGAALAEGTGATFGTRWLIGAGLGAAVVGALPLAGSVVVDKGTGALDNASGVATIFEAVECLSAAAPIGVLVTTAEELALAGARAWGEVEGAATAINCDGVDDDGPIVCVVARDRRGSVARGVAVARGTIPAAVRLRRSLPGVLFDSVALADAGWDVMTVMRGRVRSLARVHTSRDTLEAWRGDGVAETARFVAAAAGAMIAEQHGDQPAEREE